ncbi:MAG: 4'-phosphopantetheinyl transferase superfamily protein [Bacteroidota bacterium]
MPLHTNRDINEHSRIVVWEIEESIDWFLAQLHLDDDERKKYNGFRTDQRRAHWLAYRYILKTIVGKGSYIRVKYDQNNKPFIDLSDDHISVSHSGKYATVIISRDHPVGIDIEQITPRLHKVADKFISSEETGKDLASMQTDELCLHWCAKEALYKLHGEKNLDFRHQLQVIAPPDQAKGAFRGLIRSGGKESIYKLHAERVDDYCLVYAVGPPE